MIYIYKITSPNNKIYIGQTRDLNKRKSAYKCLDCKAQFRIYNSLLKYGWSSHIFEIVHYLPNDTLQNIINIYELFYWQLYKDCNIEMLNLKTCGSNGRHSQETIDKMSKKLIGNKNASGNRSKEFKENCRIRLLGKPSNMLNKKHNDVTKDKISKANKDKPAINRKQIINIENGEIYNSLVNASMEIKISLSTLSYYLNNKLPNKTTLRWHKQY